MTSIYLSRLAKFLRSTTSRLAMTYLLIIMLMSLGFSVVFYNASVRQLRRQVPPPSYYYRSSILPDDFGNITQNVEEFFRERTEEGRQVLLVRLVWLNLLALSVGGVVSYLLARKTLQPIEDSIESQNRFVSDASHELRTPITALQTTNEVALRKSKLNLAEAKELISYNAQEAAKLKLLSDGLLGLLKQDGKSPAVAPVSLQDVVTESINQVVQLAQKRGVKLDDEIPKLKILGNKQVFSQVVTILLDNAIKYSHEKGTVYLHAEERGKYVYLDVRDEGIGIKASDIPHIFERFYRADSSRSKEDHTGYGLGLAIAQRIVERYHSKIIVKSILNQGSSFTLRIPLANDN